MNRSASSRRTKSSRESPSGLVDESELPTDGVDGHEGRLPGAPFLVAVTAAGRCKQDDDHRDEREQDDLFVADGHVYRSYGIRSNPVSSKRLAPGSRCSWCQHGRTGVMFTTPTADAEPVLRLLRGRACRRELAPSDGTRRPNATSGRHNCKKEERPLGRPLRKYWGGWVCQVVSETPL
jgi:hypothetical protein